MHKTLLLVFIHGFKGGDDTFAGFPEQLRAVISNALPKISISAITYPRFETRGDLKECVWKFREWLQNIVIDLEVAAGTPSPTIDPSVRVILLGHSMGGIVAADTLLAIVGERPITSESTSDPPQLQGSLDPRYHVPPPSISSLLFPFIQGVLAFDTPYLGISPGVVAHGAETHYQTASSAYGAISEVAGLFGFGGAAAAAAAAAGAASSSSKPELQSKAALPAPNSPPSGNVWQKWGKIAMYAGAAGAVAAGGAAVYVKRDVITGGWGWVGSHLEFVGCLVRGEELKARMTSIVEINSHGVGFKNLHSLLGKGAVAAKSGTSGGSTIAGGWLEIGASESSGRTFCNLPKKDSPWRKYFESTVNDKVYDETLAHMSMFLPRENPGYYGMLEKAKEEILGWVDQGWYESSDGEMGQGENFGEASKAESGSSAKAEADMAVG